MPDRFWVDPATIMYYNWDWGKKEIPRISRWEAYDQFLPEQKITKLLGKYIQARRALREPLNLKLATGFSNCSTCLNKSGFN